MKKITLLFAIILAMYTFETISAVEINVYAVNENFDSGTLGTWGFNSSSGGLVFTNPAPVAGASFLNLLMQSPTATATKTFTTPIAQGYDNKVYFDFNWMISPGKTGNNAIMYIRDNAGNKILGVGSYYNANTSLRLLNINSTLPFTDAGLKVGAFTMGDILNIKVTLDFNLKTLDFTATKISTGTKVTLSSLSFLNATAVNVGDIYFDWVRSGTPNGNYQFDNFQIYTKKDAIVSTVTVNYLDQDGVAGKTASVVPNLEAGSTYAITLADKTTFISSGSYYAYDPIATGSESVVVAGDGSSVINLKFKKTATTSGTYSWTGITNGNWNELDANFSTDGSNSQGYQNGNAATFSGTGINKVINLNSDFNLGSNNVDITSDGYSFSGTGSLTGTGAVNLKLAAVETATLNLTNNLTGGVVISGGTAIISNDLSGTNYTIADGAKLKLQTGVAFAKPIVGTRTINIEMMSDVNYNNTLTGATTVNYILGTAGKLNSSTWSNAVNTLLPACNVNVTTTGVASGFGVADGSLTNAKVSLGDNIRLLKSYNQSSGAGSTISVGELSGTATSTLDGGFVGGRILNYYIGGLNTDATFAGTIKNFIQLDEAVTPATNLNTDVLNVYKKGTGTWTLTGASPLFRVGSFNVDAGKVILTGSLGTVAVPVIVAANATLSGTGTIAGATAVNGILEGNLNFGSSLTLAGITNLTVNGFEDGQFDVVDVVGAVTFGGALNITVSATAPAEGTSIKLFNAATYINTFSNVTVPQYYTFDNTTGKLTYSTLVSKVNSEMSTKLSVYPTLTSDNVKVSGENIASIDIISLTGQVLKQVQAKSSITSIPMTGLANGAYLVKVHFADNSVKVQRILFQE